jgi:hypothetical protein
MHHADLGRLRLLADGEAAALVDPDATVHWWCGDRFDAEPVLWGLLDRAGPAARFVDATAITADERPAGPTTTTIVSTPNGRVEVRDGLVERRLLRTCRGIDRPLDVVHEVAFGGFDGGDALGPVRTRIEAPRLEWRALEVTRAGVRRTAPADAASRFDGAEARHAEAVGAKVPKVHDQRTQDALAVIHACTYAPTGATVAAVTTSLPEAVGGDRQFDYRYAWLRDGSLAASVASLTGRQDIAENHLAFVRRLGLRIFDAPLFTVEGRPVPHERVVRDVPGWRASTPVRVGNAAAEQLQFDALGFVNDAVLSYVECGGRLDRSLWLIVRAVADRCCEEPDVETAGIWEFRRPQHFVSAEIGRWIALDRAIRLAGNGAPWRRASRRWRATRDRCRDRVLRELREDGRLPQVLGGDPAVLDASGLLIAISGMLELGDPRAEALVDAHVKDLGDGPFLYRYYGIDDDFVGREATFTPCSWWAVAALARVGRVDDAEQRADELCARLPRLLSEEFDPATGTSLGNVPLVWSHAELARAMYSIDVAKRAAGAG